MKLVSISPTVVVDPDKILIIKKEDDYVYIVFGGGGETVIVDDATYEQILQTLAKADNIYIDGDGHGVWG